MADVEGVLATQAGAAPETEAPGPSFEGENKFQHAISAWRSKKISLVIYVCCGTAKIDFGEQTWT
jgi:hypothetical protein